MPTVSHDVSVVESDLLSGLLSCPSCSGRLRSWGRARSRTIRHGIGGVSELVEHQPRRGRRARCRRTHVLLPVVLAIDRALMAEPTYLLMDEPSLGLAPQIVEQIRDLIVDIRDSGTGVLLVEQNAAMALSIADHGYVMENGKIVMDAAADVLRSDEDIREFYLGMGADATSLRDVKHYKRRKRWLS